jgi:hypothetical protein
MTAVGAVSNRDSRSLGPHRPLERKRLFLLCQIDRQGRHTCREAGIQRHVRQAQIIRDAWISAIHAGMTIPPAYPAGTT